MADLNTAIDNVEKILANIKVYTDLPRLNSRQLQALRINVGTLKANVAALRAAAAAPVGKVAEPKAPATVTGDASILPLVPVKLDSNSPDTATYLQQLFAIEAGQKYTGVWPSEATDEKSRQFQLIQLTGSILSSGPKYHKDPLLSVYQVLYAANLEDRFENELNLNPELIAAFNRAKDLLATADEGAIPWAGQSTDVVVHNEGSYGQVAESGWYGTGEGPKPV